MSARREGAPLPEAAMVFAAGFGRRMGDLTRHRPKPLIEVAGRALIDRQLDLLDRAGISRRVVNLHYRAGAIADHVGARATCLTEPVLLDTGGGLKAALPHLSDPVVTMTADAVWDGPNPVDIVAAGWDGRAEALLLVVPLDRAVGRQGGGDFALAGDGSLRRGGDYVFTGVQILRTGAVEARAEDVFSLNVVWDLIAARRALRGVLYPGLWADVGHPEGIALAEAMLRRA